MASEDEAPSEPTANVYWQVLNREFFTERNRLLDSERILAAQYESAPTPVLQKALRQTRLSLKRVTGKIVETNTGLVVKCVSHFTKKATPEQRDEYLAAGMSGLVEAMNSYDMTNDSFATWAYWPVLRAVLRAVHAEEHSTLSARDFDKRPAVQNAFEQAAQAAGGSPPSVEDVAARAGVNVEQVKRILLATSMDGMGKTWGKKLAAKPSVSGFEEPRIPQEVEDDLWEARLRELTKDLPIQDFFVFMRRTQGLEEGGVAESYESIAQALDISREAVRKADLRAREAIRAKGWEIPWQLE